METIEEKLARASSTTDRMHIHDMDYIGIICTKCRVYRVYEDEEQNTWYETCFLDENTGEILTEEEHLFGRKRKYAL